MMNKFFISIFLFHCGAAYAQEISTVVQEMTLPEIELALQKCEVEWQALQQKKKAIIKKKYADNARKLRCNKVKIINLNKQMVRVRAQVDEHSYDTQLVNKLAILQQEQDILTEENELIVDEFPNLETVLNEPSRL